MELKMLSHITWTLEEYQDFVSWLKTLEDENYRNFQAGLIPGVDNMLGIRLPLLRKIGKEISKGDFRGFLKVCQQNYYEEVMLKGIVIGLIKVEYTEFIRYVEEFSHWIDNWAVCDSFCNGLKEIKKYKADFFLFLLPYLFSENPWQIRMALIIMLTFYIEKATVQEVLSRCDQVKSDHYYVRMGQAWLISMCYLSFPEITLNYLKHCSLDDWTYNKSLQKARESLRTSSEEKERLNQLKR